MARAVAGTDGATRRSRRGWRDLPRVVRFGLPERALEPELMDDPGLDRALHEEALVALARINRVSLTDRRVSGEVARLWRAGERPVRVLDVGCGDADVLMRVGLRARASGIDVDLHGCDVSELALARARSRAAAAGVPLELSRVDVMRDPLPAGGFTLVTCSLFLHHLPEDTAATLLARMAAASRRMLVQDLRRTRLGFLLAWAGVHGLTRSRIARVDSLRSVRAAFTRREAEGLCERAGLPNARVATCWPQRLLIRHPSG